MPKSTSARKPKNSESNKPAPVVTFQQWLGQLPEILNDKVAPEKLDLLAAQTMVINQAKPTDDLTSAAMPSPMPLIIRTQAALREAAERICKATNISLDIETSSIDPRRGEIVGVGVAIEGQAFYFPTAHRFDDTGDLLPDQLPVADVVEQLQLERCPVITHNGKFEMRWLRHHARATLNLTWDNRPWERTTGPKTREGKAKSARNGHAKRAAVRAYHELRRVLQELIAPAAAMRKSFANLLAEVGSNSDAG